jgi:hypothetical protein
MLTKKHFVGIARILREQQADHGLVQALAAYFKSENPRFDAARFWRAVRGEMR